MKKIFTNWQIPKDMEEKILPKFPTECLGTILKKYTIELAEELQVPEDMVGTAILGILGLCNQGKYKVEARKGWQETLNLFTLIIANPSEKKSPICKRLTNSIYEYEKQKNISLQPKIMSSKDNKQILEKKLANLKKKLIKNDNANKDSKINIENIKKEIKDLQEQLIEFEEVNEVKLIADDVTPEALSSIMAKNNEKMAIISAEGGIFATMNGRYNNNVPNFDIFLKAYSNEPIKIDRQNGETKTLYNPLLTMVLFVQPVILEQVFSNYAFKGRGLCSRFLYTYPESKVGKRAINTKLVSEELENNYNELIANLISTNIENKILKLSDEAYFKFIEFNEFLENQLLENLYDMNDWAGKLLGIALRLAGNLHVVNNYSTYNFEINEQIMESAIKLSKYFLSHAQNVYSIIGTNAEYIKAKRIIRILKSKNIKGTIKRHDIYRLVRGSGINKVKDIFEPCNLLIELGYFRQLDQIYNGSGRKPDILIELNPLVFN